MIAGGPGKQAESFAADGQWPLSVMTVGADSVIIAVPDWQPLQRVVDRADLTVEYTKRTYWSVFVDRRSAEPVVALTLQIPELGFEVRLLFGLKRDELRIRALLGATRVALVSLAVSEEIGESGAAALGKAFERGRAVEWPKLPPDTRPLTPILDLTADEAKELLLTQMDNDTCPAIRPVGIRLGERVAPGRCFMAAAAYEDDGESSAAIQRLNEALADDGTYLSRVMLQDNDESARAQWLVLCLAADCRTKDKLLLLDWGASSASVTEQVPDSLWAQAYTRWLNPTLREEGTPELAPKDVVFVDGDQIWAE
jgi:hypothetical protein